MTLRTGRFTRPGLRGTPHPKVPEAQVNQVAGTVIGALLAGRTVRYCFSRSFMVSMGSSRRAVTAALPHMCAEWSRSRPSQIGGQSFGSKPKRLGPPTVGRLVWPWRGSGAPEAAGSVDSGMGRSPIWTTICSSGGHAQDFLPFQAPADARAAPAASGFDAVCCPCKQSHIGSWM